MHLMKKLAKAFLVSLLALTASWAGADTTAQRAFDDALSHSMPPAVRQKLIKTVPVVRRDSGGAYTALEVDGSIISTGSGGAVASTDITDSGATGRSLLQSANQASAYTALGVTATAQAFVQSDAAADMRTVIAAQESGARLDDINGLSASLVQGDILYYSGTALTRLAPGTVGNFLRTGGAGANPSWAAISGGGDALVANPLSQFASTTSAQLLGVISNESGTGSIVANTSPTLTTPTFSGNITRDGAELITSNAMPALAINVGKAVNTKSISADSTFTFSATPTADTWFGMHLANTDTAGHTIVIPSSYSMATQSARTSFVIPASSEWFIQWRYKGAGVYAMYGEPRALDNYAATAAPGVNDDSADGYAVGSQWIDTTADIEYVCVDATATAAVWKRRYTNTFGASTVGLVPAASASPDSTKFLNEAGTFTAPVGGYSQVDYTTGSAHTGTLTPTAVWTKTIPAGTLVAGKRMKVEMRLVRTGTTTAYTITVALGGQTLDTLSVGSSNVHAQFVTRAKTNATQATADSTSTGAYTIGSVATTATTVDGTASQDLTVSITLGDTGTSVTPQEIDIRID
jgi:hypothetical protein